MTRPSTERANRILLLSGAPERLQSWRQELSAAGWQVLTENDPSESDSIRIVVTDQALPALPATADEEAGLIAVGAAGPADVELPADATPREIRLAADLLRQIVDLRAGRREDQLAQHSLRQLALTDPLTGVPNRRGWDERLRRLAAGDSDTPPALCLAIVDLDRFKDVNDRLGHAAGDQILAGAAAALLASLRDSDFVARLGGDEFGLLLAGIRDEDARTVVERVRVTVSDRLAEQHRVTASAGLAVAASGETLDRCFERADRALRQAKSLGRDRTVAAEPPGAAG